MIYTSKLIEGTQKAKVRLFVLLGAQQAIAVNEIVKKEPYYKNICFNFTNIAFQEMENCEIIVVNSKPLIIVALQYASIFNIIKKIRNSATEFHVFIPHAYHAIANYLAFYSNPDTINLLPDGILNYFDGKVGNRQYFQMVKKKILFLLGGRYHCYRGNLTGCEYLKFHSHYAFSDKALYTKVGKQILINLPQIFTPDDRTKIFILDQPLHNLPQKASFRIQKALQNYLGEDKGLWIYKPHRDQEVCNISISEFSSSITVNKFKIAEYIIKDFPIAEIVSISSSALITLKIMYPDIPCVAIGLNVVIENNPKHSTTAAAMAKFGIKFIDAPPL